MTPGADEWRVAYAKQAKADLASREKLLAHADLPESQQLHFLQMACEKICKAYLCGRNTDPAALQTSHAYVATTLPIIARQQFALRSGHSPKSHSWMIGAVRKLARKIELLAPAVKGGGTYPANCEYPWVASDGTVKVPAEHNFELDLLHEAAGRHLLKVLYSAVDDLIRPEPVA
ncbi:MAG: hypothetical protein AVDCRST_MAG64-584 [uncultured Phycisphaerae bacterium]|uniref:HEPN domain-containing protein n=1 Tax=uncultured Phycisphaerae bacterium TaxID=904963 RepID=A0A6J4NAV3_9BACT|nr:MAG: hypothetical protein AVDCRST_MAG64-584 [uncultured Phycisphaerae bacterium]